MRSSARCAGAAGGADFWAWRELMLAEAELQTPATVRRNYVDVYRELRAAGYTAVGEFHYLGFDEALAAVEAAEEAGIRIVLLLAAYERGGLPRFRQESVTEYLAPGRGPARTRRRGRACPPLRARGHGFLARGDRALRGCGAACRCTSMPTSSHARSRSASPSTACARSSCSARTGCLSERTTIVHATHADGAELDLLAQAGARICACPTTEANLGDGFLPVERVCTRSVGICIGSDSNVRIDPLEELRELEGIARRQSGRRNVISTETLLCFGADEGAGALGLEEWDDVEVDLGHRSLRGVDDVFEGLVAGCGADVFVRASGRSASSSNACA